MKKNLALICAIALAGTMLFTACSSDNKDNDNTTVTTEAVTESSEETTEEITEDSSEETDEITEDTTEEGEPSEEAPVEESALMPLVDAAMSSQEELPSLAQVDDADFIKDYFLLDTANENYQDIIVMQCPMSAVMSEIIIIKANDVEAAKADLEARQSKAQESDAWYPNDIELAASSVVGTEGDYAFFVLLPDSETAATAIADAVKAL